MTQCEVHLHVLHQFVIGSTSLGTDHNSPAAFRKVPLCPPVLYFLMCRLVITDAIHPYVATAEVANATGFYSLAITVISGQLPAGNVLISHKQLLVRVIGRCG